MRAKRVVMCAKGEVRDPARGSKENGPGDLYVLSIRMENLEHSKNGRHIHTYIQLSEPC